LSHGPSPTLPFFCVFFLSFLSFLPSFLPFFFFLSSFFLAVLGFELSPEFKELETLHQAFFMMGFVKIESGKLLAWADFEP
jgi:hypothetical protein